MLKTGIRLGLGFASFLIAHAIEIVLWQRAFGGEHEPWFLNTRRAAAFTLASLFAASAIAAAGRGRPVAHGLQVGAGAVTAMLALLLLTGQGTLFPIVLAFGGGLITLTTVAGAWLGGVIGARR